MRFFPRQSYLVFLVLKQENQHFFVFLGIFRIKSRCGVSRVQLKIGEWWNSVGKSSQIVLVAGRNYFRPMETINWQDFEKVEMRIGTIIRAWEAEGVKVPAYRMEVDFGPLGIRKTSAQLTKRYTPETLTGRKVVAVVNFPPKQIGKFMSECLVLGAVDGNGDVALLSCEQDAPDGWRVA